MKPTNNTPTGTIQVKFRRPASDMSTPNVIYGAILPKASLGWPDVQAWMKQQKLFPYHIVSWGWLSRPKAVFNRVVRFRKPGNRHYVNP